MDNNQVNYRFQKLRELENKKGIGKEIIDVVISEGIEFEIIREMENMQWKKSSSSITKSKWLYVFREQKMDDDLQGIGYFYLPLLKKRKKENDDIDVGSMGMITRGDLKENFWDFLNDDELELQKEIDRIQEDLWIYDIPFIKFEPILLDEFFKWRNYLAGISSQQSLIEDLKQRRLMTLISLKKMDFSKGKISVDDVEKRQSIVKFYEIPKEHDSWLNTMNLEIITFFHTLFSVKLIDNEMVNKWWIEKEIALVQHKICCNNRYRIILKILTDFGFTIIDEINHKEKRMDEIPYSENNIFIFSNDEMKNSFNEDELEFTTKTERDSCIYNLRQLWFKIPFELGFKLLRLKLRIHSKKERGFMFISTIDMIQYVIPQMIEIDLNNLLKILKLPNYSKQEELKKYYSNSLEILNSIYKFGGNDNSKNRIPIMIQDIEDLAKDTSLMPLCQRIIFHKLKRDHHLQYNDRWVYASYLLDLNFDKNIIAENWWKEFKQNTSKNYDRKKFDTQCASAVKRNKDYAIRSSPCKTMSIGKNNCWCPYALLTESELKKHLRETTPSLNETQLTEICHLVTREHKPLEACMLEFNITHQPSIPLQKPPTLIKQYTQLVWKSRKKE